MFIDASAIVAFLANEPEKAQIMKILSKEGNILFSPITVFETVNALVKQYDVPFEKAKFLVLSFLDELKARNIPITTDIQMFALEASEKYGRGRHPADLNMGDCFSYACAKRHHVPLLFKGNDFTHTDIQSVL